MTAGYHEHSSSLPHYLRLAWMAHRRGICDDEAFRLNPINVGGSVAMAEPFDALYQWLGIPPAEQPPHHYRLLGIQLYETSADVIFHAADRHLIRIP